MNKNPEDLMTEPFPIEDEQIIEPVEFGFGLKRRTFVQLVATGIMIATAPFSSLGRNRFHNPRDRAASIRPHIVPSM